MTLAGADVGESRTSIDGASDAAPGRHLLLITPLDITKLLNNLEQHRIANYRRRGCRVTVVYKTMNHGSRFRDLLRDTLTFSIRERWEDGARIIAVDPPFNYFAGFRANAEAGAEAVDGERNRSPRLLLMRALSPLSILRDLFATPWFCLAVLLKVRTRCDVRLGFGPWGGLAGLILRKLGRVRTLVFEDRDYEAGVVPDRLRRWYTTAVERVGMRRADVTISIGHLLSERRRDELGLATHVIPSGVDRSIYARARASISPHPNLIYVGNVISWSGLEHAIAAMPRVREAVPDAALLVVGTGVPNYVEHLRELAARTVPGDAVRFLGQREPSELPGFLETARIGLANSQPVLFRRYATPLKVVEYMAAGLPVIATEGTEAGIIVTRCDCGEAIPYDADALAEAVIRMLGDDERYRAQREHAMEHSRAYDWDSLLSRELELIAECER